MKQWASVLFPSAKKHSPLRFSFEIICCVYIIIFSSFVEKRTSSCFVYKASLYPRLNGREMGFISSKILIPKVSLNRCRVLETTRRVTKICSLWGNASNAGRSESAKCHTSSVSALLGKRLPTSFVKIIPALFYKLQGVARNSTGLQMVLRSRVSQKNPM